MSGIVKWTLAAVLLIAALVFAYTRISDAIDDFQMQLRNDSRIEQVEPKQPEAEPSDPQPAEPEPQKPSNDQRPWLQDRLIRT